VGEFCAQTRAEIRKEFRDKDRELEAKIAAALERCVELLSQGKRARYTFVRKRRGRRADLPGGASTPCGGWSLASKADVDQTPKHPNLSRKVASRRLR
jgi:hypothetical protein